MAAMVEAKNLQPNFRIPRIMTGTLRIKTMIPFPKGRKSKRSKVMAMPESPPGVSPEGPKKKEVPTA